MATEDPLPQGVSRRPAGRTPALTGSMTTVGARATWISGLVLSISAFTDWYAEMLRTSPEIQVARDRRAHV